MSEKPLEFTAAEVGHLLTLLERNEGDGGYWGCAAQSMNRERNDKILNKLRAYIGLSELEAKDAHQD